MSLSTPIRLGGLLVSGSLLLAGCDVLTALEDAVRGSGVLATEQRDVRGASAVVMAAPGTLFVQQGDREELRIEADDNLIGHLRTRVDGRTLRIDVQPGRILQPARPIRYYLVVQDLERLTLSSSGSAEIRNLAVFELEAVLGGSGDLLLDRFGADRLSLTVSGSGRARAAGAVIEQTVALTGSGDFEARALESRFADVHTSGSGSATVRVRERLTARVAGSGSVFYYGSPQVQRTVTGSGTVRRLGN
jgi:hypothetical protein